MNDLVKKMPNNPGVYIMKNSKNSVIYIGKAKNLKKRVSSYFTGSNNQKTQELVKNINDIDYIICNKEVEALILENNLIKEHKPKYNILLKDQKTYPYIKITKEKYPSISYTRNLKDDALYFGPYPTGNIKKMISDLIRIFKIRDCHKSKGDTKRPCLKFYMGLCIAPCCTNDESRYNEYADNVNNLILFLQNKDDSVIKYYENKMNEYTKNMDFENAIIERERIKNLKKFLQNQITEFTKEYDEDIFAFNIKDNNAYLCVMSIRHGKLISKSENVFKQIIDTDVLDTLIAKYYENLNPPKKIVLDYKYIEKKDTLEKWFLIKKNIKVNILFPRKGRLYDLLKLAKLNLEI